MFLPDLVVRSRRVVTPHGTRPAAIHIRRGKIAGVLDFDEVLPGSPTEDVEGVVIPGLIDTSLSARELESATRAAAAGGITTLVVQMEERQSCLSGQAGSPVLHTDVAFWNDAEGTLLAAPSTLDDLQRLIASWRPGGARIHLQRVPSWEMLTPLFNAQRARVPISAGTTAHDLTVNANESDRRNREYLWAALANGLLRTVSSFDLTPLASMLPAVWAAARARGYTIEQLVDWMCGAPAKLAGLTRKGQIDPGFDADLVVFDSEGEAVLRTYLRGQQIDLQSAHGRSISRNVN